MEPKAEPVRLPLPDRIEATSLRELSGQLLSRGRKAPVVLDAGRLEQLDSLGAARLLRLIAQSRNAGVDVRITNLPQGPRRMLERMDAAVLQGEPPPERRPALESVGVWALENLDAASSVASLSRETARAASVPFGKRGIRWDRTATEIVRIGATAVPIVVFISLLIGVVLALNGALQLRQFGAAIFIANLVAISMTREMGPLVTAVIVAGRSGSAIAAELGTMVVSEEIAAMQTMAISPVRFLVVPKIVALVIAMPLLTTMSSTAGILGGYLVGTMGLGLASSAYLTQTVQALFVSDVLTGLVKSVVFAVIIGLTGAWRGLGVPMDPAAVGQATTSAVVTSIVLSIIANAVFTMIFYLTG